MKLRNKKTREVVDLFEIVRIDDLSNEFYLRLSDNEGRTFKVGFNSLAELNEEWEDAPEEPKEYWFIGYDAQIECISENDSDGIELDKSIGNYFETKEEAEKAVEKLKAWKRLKDKGFRFIGKTYETDKRFGSIFYKVDEDTYSEDIMLDLDLLFGGEE